MPKRKATYKIFVTRREYMSVGDQPDHTLMLTELEGEPIELTVGVAGEFISRRSVGFHDRIKGSGKMEGYAMSTFQHGQVYSRFEASGTGPPRSPAAPGRCTRARASSPASPATGPSR